MNEDEKDAVVLGAELAKELNALSMNDREGIYHDIHGISEMKETSELIEKSLNQIEHALNAMQLNDAYRLAESMNKEYVQDRKYRLMFLRAEEFDASAAACRMNRFLQNKLDLFGIDKLCQDIKLKDLSASDLKCYQTGAIQILSRRDRAGRAVRLGVPFYWEYDTMDNVLRYEYYNMMTALQDEETQKMGFVEIIYIGNLGFTPLKIEEATRLTSLLNSIPWCCRGRHFCTANTAKGNFLSLAFRLMEIRARQRTRFQSGMIQEVFYTLMTFGIPVEHIPLSTKEELNTKRHQKWIASRPNSEKMYEELSKQGKKVVMIPSLRDVLLGRGAPTQSYPGNAFLLALVEASYEKYNGLTRNLKVLLGKEVIEQIRQRGGSFLKQMDGFTWVEADEVEVRKKVSDTFRTFRASLKKKGMGVLKRDREG